MGRKSYLQNQFWCASKSERKVIGRSCLERWRANRAWEKRYYSNWRFLAKWTREKYSASPRLSARRCRAYQRHYGLTHTPSVQFGVQILCEHSMNGRLEIGKNVSLLKDCFIDYTGNVTIRDNVYIAFGTIIQTHYHPNHSDWRQPAGTVATDLLIEEDVIIGSRAIIMPSCHYIGKHARVGAGSVVTHDVPDYAIVAGSPAKVIRIQES